MTVTAFEYDSRICERFPAVRAVVVVVDGIDNTTSPAGLIDFCRSNDQSAIERLANVRVAEHDSIRAWRSVFTSLGVKPTQYRNAAEALLRRLDRHGELPAINPMVDVGNAVSVRYALPVAVFDADRIMGTLRVTLATGNESFRGFGGTGPETPGAGEVVFIDDADQVAARRWCWKQAEPTAANPATTRAMFVIEAVHVGVEDALDSAEHELGQLLHHYFPGVGVSSARSSALDPLASLS
ncbi:MAG: hypothetical protein HKN24_13775 [Acidimicrobiales bacterium]|nr:hypothetical protein [Acidimicrobiales bacterium]